MVARVARAQLHAQYSWTCRDVWPGKNSWYWMAREQAWPPAEHSPSDPAPFVTTQADIVPSVDGRRVHVEVDLPRPAVRRHLANGLDVQGVHDAGGHARVPRTVNGGAHRP